MYVDPTSISLSNGAGLCRSQLALSWCRRHKSQEAAAIVVKLMRQDNEDAIRNMGAVMLAQRHAPAVAFQGFV